MLFVGLRNCAGRLKGFGGQRAGGYNCSSQANRRFQCRFALVKQNNVGRALNGREMKELTPGMEKLSAGGDVECHT